MKGPMAVMLALLLAGCGAQGAGNEIGDSAVAPAAAPVPLADSAWNLADGDALTNGNIAIAAAKLLRGDELPDGTASLASIAKAPWDFYGQRVCIPAEVASVTDMPPASDLALQFGGKVAEIVAMADGQQVLDMLVLGGSGSVESGDRLKMCGMVVGRTEVPNALGGKFSHLVMVGKLKPPA